MRQLQAVLPLKKHLGYLGTFGVVTTEKVLLTSGGWRPGLLLSFLQGTGRPPAENHQAHNVNSTG